MWQSTEAKNENGSVMTQNKTKWSVHLEVMEVQEYIRDIHTKKVETHMCDIHSKILKTFRIFVWHSQKEKRDSYTQKEAKRYGSPHNMGNVCEIKRNKKKWKSIVWQLHKIKWDSSEWDIHSEEPFTNMVQRVYDICDSHK